MSLFRTPIRVISTAAFQCIAPLLQYRSAAHPLVNTLPNH